MTYIDNNIKKASVTLQVFNLNVIVFYKESKINLWSVLSQPIT